jgi:hypothetical protein
MKTSATLKLVILFGAMVIVMAAQWRAYSRLRQENRELQGIREQAEQVRTELEQATQTSVQHESEAQSLRTEVVTLRSELQTVRKELEQAQTAAKKAATSAQGALPRTGASLQPGVAGRWSSRERTVFHMHPTVRTNLAPLPSEYRCSYKSGGRVDDVELWNSITGETITAAPDWWPSQPLPLSFTDGEKIARDELRKLVSDEPQWEITGILHRLRDGSSAKWHYGFEFAPVDRTVFDMFTVHVSMAGVPGTTGLRVGDR